MIAQPAARQEPERPAGGGPPPAPVPAPPLLHWTRVLGAGLLLWLASVALLVTTGAITLVPTVILLGSFLVPVTAVTFFFEHDPGPTLHLRTVVEAFLIGGLLGVFGAVALEAVLVGPGPFQYLGVGLIEEGAKLAALVLIARRLPAYTTRDGIVLGAAVGFGFGALESSGYAFAALLAQNGLSLPDLLQTEVLRGLLAPVGHGLWTGILGGILFRGASATGRLRPSWALVGAYLAVAALHGLWDSMGDLASLLTYVFTATPAQRLAVESGRPGRLRPSEGQAVLYLLLYGGGLLIASAVGLLWVHRLWTAGRPAPGVAEASPSAGPA
jgi:RsiW-degrading membrane proteinase PrsW (M82 family)